MRRPPTLIINSPQQQQHEKQHTVKYKAKTTLTAGAHPLQDLKGKQSGSPKPSPEGKDRGGEGLRKRFSSAPTNNGSGGSKPANGAAESDVRRGSLQLPQYTRGVSVGADGGSQPFTPRNFKVGDLNLAYDRSKMRKPSVSGTPSPMDDTPGTLAQLTGEVSYIPKIAVHTKSWPSFLARNYYRLNNAKLIMTFLINVILLTYQVS